MTGEFSVNQDFERALSVEVQQITIKFEAATSIGHYSLIRAMGSRNSPYIAEIDSSRPYLYLPDSICRDMAQVLGLAYDNQTEHYLISAENHADFQSKNPALEFQLASTGGKFGSDALVNVSIPYSSLALNLSFPIMKVPGISSLYFPIKAATSEKQYSLGRAFLQEVYLIANYERGKFSLKNVNWARISSIKPTAVPILSTRNSSSNPPYLCTNSHTTRKTIVGVVLGVLIPALVIAILIIWSLLRRRRRKNEEATHEKDQKSDLNESTSGSELPNLSITSPNTTVTPIAEAGGNPVDLNELHAKTIITEMPDAPIFELYSPPSELEACSKVSEAQSHTFTQKRVLPQNEPNDPGINENPPAYHPVPASPIPATPLEYYGREARERLRPPAREIHTIGERTE
jgi:hypothetical protein